jgi:hypothetical protein
MRGHITRTARTVVIQLGSLARGQIVFFVTLTRSLFGFARLVRLCIRVALSRLFIFLLLFDFLFQLLL